jgi:Chaperone of endosialidase
MPDIIEGNELTIAKGKPHQIKITEGKIEGKGHLDIHARATTSQELLDRGFLNIHARALYVIPIVANTPPAIQLCELDGYVKCSIQSVKDRNTGVNYLAIYGGENGPHSPDPNRTRETRIEGALKVNDWGVGKGEITATDVLINSSQELKQDISTLTKEDAYKLMEDLEPIKFAFKDDPSKRKNVGFVAEEVPDIIASEDHKQVRYMEIISVLTKVVKEQQKEIENIKKQIKN